MPPFAGAVHGPVLTLVFGSAAAQHAALARVECFYESEKHANTYLTLEQARDARICKGYEAFNLPTSALDAWLAAMHAAEGAQDVEEGPWYQGLCTPEEQDVLAYLDTLAPRPTYLVAALVQSAEVALAHERLHALYHLSAPYRTLLDTLWNDLSRPVRGAIEYDLKMRGYKESVWPDELGAYLGVRVTPATKRGDPSLEFGNKCADECRDVRRVLLAKTPAFWREDAGVDEASLELSPAFLDAARAALVVKAPAAPKPAKGPRKPRKK